MVQNLAPNSIVWDADLKGFCARRQSGTTVSYLVKTRVAGRIRWIAIGRHGQPWTPETARKRALKILADPLAAETAAPSPLPAVMTVADAAQQFFATHGRKLKPRTIEGYQRHHRIYIMPALGREPITALTRAQISKHHAAWSAHPRAANHALAYLSKLLNWAEAQGYRPEGSNPVPRIERYHENRRERFLTSEELGRLGTALVQADTECLVSPSALAAIRLLIFTGARLNEILTLKWSYVDLERRMIFLPDSKTGQKPIILNDAALEVLAARPRLVGNPYVITGHRDGASLVNLQKPWRAIRAKAGLDDVRLHDLRHTFASIAVASGGSLPILGRQLGHSQPQTTQRYAHLADDPVRQLTETTGQTLAQALKPLGSP
ncbi:MAG: hypothetical protein APF80_13435 [Alphaproteobacteria bacterium BRH_c36]|nr:MAG: hypothetical protein APF80_13435 [Alphaproteobacteria bacterium BRH_c36]